MIGVEGCKQFWYESSVTKFWNFLPVRSYLATFWANFYAIMANFRSCKWLNVDKII